MGEDHVLQLLSNKITEVEDEMERLRHIQDELERLREVGGRAGEGRGASPVRMDRTEYLSSPADAGLDLGVCP